MQIVWWIELISWTFCVGMSMRVWQMLTAEPNEYGKPLLSDFHFFIATKIKDRPIWFKLWNCVVCLSFYVSCAVFCFSPFSVKDLFIFVMLSMFFTDKLKGDVAPKNPNEP